MPGALLGNAGCDQPDASPTGRQAPAVVVIMGVSGCGKSTVALLVAQRLRWTFFEGDDYHPAANVAKMASGRPLTDADRLPWLEAQAAALEAHAAAQGGGAVLACSALQPEYRRVLRGSSPPGAVAFVLLEPGLETLQANLAARAAEGSHFMPPSLLASQLAALRYRPEELLCHLGPGHPPWTPQQAADRVVVALREQGCS